MTDPAAGKFEFPGGHVEGDESPRAAAIREFQEETGLPFVDGEWTGTWTASNGIYQGFVLTIAREADLDIFARQLRSDPDGDVDGTETIAWIDPADLPANPMVRAELLGDIDAVMAALGCGPDDDPACCGGECCADGCCGGAAGCSCSSDGVAKAGDAGPKGLAALHIEVEGRRQRLLAKHESAVQAAWDQLTAQLDPAQLVSQFRAATGQVTKAAGPDRAWWKDHAKAAAVAWLLLLREQRGWTVLVDAIAAAIRDGMAEGEADALAAAATRAGAQGFSVDAAFTAAASRVAGDPQAGQLAEDTAQALLDATATALATTLAAAGEHDDDEHEEAEEVTATVSSRPWAGQLGDGLTKAAGAGALALLARITDGSQPDAPAAGQPPAKLPPPPDVLMINWVCESGSPCVICQQNQGGSPYAPQDVPPYLAHPNCRCGLYPADNISSSYYAAYLLE